MDDDKIKILQEYRDNMEWPAECLSIQLDNIGFKGEGLLDHELVEVATRKLKVMYSMLLASGMNEKLLKAVMSE